jgi:Holliday junction DNA helicase RuvA
MIGALRGTIESISGQTVILMTGGVGYQVSIPNAGTLEPNNTIFLYTYLAVRETALDLYGFTRQSDKVFFELLLSVPKIGPKSALQILGQADVNFIVECIQTEDSSRLHKLAGIGKKTCENIVTNLKDKVDSLTLQSRSPSDSTLSSTQIDAIDALISLGYDPKTARTSILAQTNKDLTVSDLVAAALK